MSERGDVISADDPFAASIADLDSGQYLGDGQVLEGLVRMMISEAFEADGPDGLEVLVETFARAMLGMNPKMAVVPGWNREGVIDTFVTEWTGIKGESGIEVLKRYGLGLIDQAADVASYAAQPDVVRDDWAWQLDAIVIEAVRLLQGVSPVTDLGVEVATEPETSGDAIRRVTEGWVTIGQDEDGEGGHPVLIDGAGKMKSGKFAGETMKGAFGKGGKADQVAAAKPKGDESRPAPAEGNSTYKSLDGKNDHYIAGLAKDSMSRVSHIMNATDLDVAASDLKAKFPAVASKVDAELAKAKNIRAVLDGKKAPVAKAATAPAEKPNVAKPEPHGWSDSHQSAYEKFKAFSLSGGADQEEFSQSDKSPQAALQAFVSHEFVEMNGDPNHPAVPKLKGLLDTLPDYKPKSGKIHRVLGFEDGESADAFVKSLDSPQAKSFSSWTEDDPTAAGATPMNNIGLDLASQFGDHTVILSYEDPVGAKDITFAYGHKGTGSEQLLQAGHQFEVASVKKDGNKTLVTLRNPTAAPAPTPKVRESKAKVTSKGESLATFKSLTKGSEVSPASLVGAPDDAEVSVHSYPNGPYEVVEINVSGPGIVQMKRKLTREGGVLKMSNSSLETTEPGLGRKMLKDQIANAKAIGVSKITTMAAGFGPKANVPEPGSENGYYTWPRYGYDAPVSSLHPGVRSKVLKQFPDAKSVSDVMATANGRSWWKDHGEEFLAEFDLSDGSRSMGIFNAYLKAKGEL